MNHFKTGVCFLLLSAALCGNAAPKFHFRTTRIPADGFAEPGEKIVFTAELMKDGKPAVLPFRSELRVEGKDVVVKKETDGSQWKPPPPPADSSTFPQPTFPKDRNVL